MAALQFRTLVTIFSKSVCCASGGLSKKANHAQNIMFGKKTVLQIFIKLSRLCDGKGLLMRRVYINKISLVIPLYF